MKRYKAQSNDRLSRIYHNMKTRCYNQNYDKYQWYGGKGVTICDEWLESYQAFESWALDHGYANDLTLDRIDTDGNYCPENCRWVSRKEQANNRSSNTCLTYNGETKTIAEWSKETGLTQGCISQRLRLGWPVNRILEERSNLTNHPYMVTYNGVTKRLHEWAKDLGMKYSTLHNRISFRGWDIERALTTPVGGRQ